MNYDGDSYGPRRQYVIINGDRVSTELIETIDIEENFLGQDIVTFKFEGKTYKSVVISS